MDQPNVISTAEDDDGLSPYRTFPATNGHGCAPTHR